MVDTVEDYEMRNIEEVVSTNGERYGLWLVRFTGYEPKMYSSLDEAKQWRDAMEYAVKTVSDDP